MSTPPLSWDRIGSVPTRSLDEAKVRGTADEKPARSPGHVNGGQSNFSLVPLCDLLSTPDAPVDYILEGLLVAGTVSAVVAKPKVGKSTLARNLALAVSLGKDFLGCPTRQGEVIYLALEERPEDIKADFAAMGATGQEPIHIHADTAPEAAMPALVQLVREYKPVLVVIDPLFRLARIRDEKAYAETYAALGPLIDIARETGTHILLTHHAGKSMKADAIDAPLGSTALGGIVSTLLVLKRGESYRTIQTVQRIGSVYQRRCLRSMPHPALYPSVAVRQTRNNPKQRPAFSITLNTLESQRPRIRSAKK